MNQPRKFGLFAYLERKSLTLCKFAIHLYPSNWLLKYFIKIVIYSQNFKFLNDFFNNVNRKKSGSDWCLSLIHIQDAFLSHIYKYNFIVTFSTRFPLLYIVFTILRAGRHWQLGLTMLQTKLLDTSMIL